jgi:hypothetical protein
LASAMGVGLQPAIPNATSKTKKNVFLNMPQIYKKIRSVIPE